jgi:hypothetical protein
MALPDVMRERGHDYVWVFDPRSHYRESGVISVTLIMNRLGEEETGKLWCQPPIDG